MNTVISIKQICKALNNLGFVTVVSLLFMKTKN